MAYEYYVHEYYNLPHITLSNFCYLLVILYSNFHYLYLFISCNEFNFIQLFTTPILPTMLNIENYF